MKAKILLMSILMMFSFGSFAATDAECKARLRLHGNTLIEQYVTGPYGEADIGYYGVYNGCVYVGGINSNSDGSESISWFPQYSFVPGESKPGKKPPIETEKPSETKPNNQESEMVSDGEGTGTGAGSGAEGAGSGNEEGNHPSEPMPEPYSKPEPSTEPVTPPAEPVPPFIPAPDFVITAPSDSAKPVFGNYNANPNEVSLFTYNRGQRMARPYIDSFDLKTRIYLEDATTPFERDLICSGGLEIKGKMSNVSEYMEGGDYRSEYISAFNGCFYRAKGVPSNLPDDCGKGILTEDVAKCVKAYQKGDLVWVPFRGINRRYICGAGTHYDAHSWVHCQPNEETENGVNHSPVSTDSGQGSGNAGDGDGDGILNELRNFHHDFNASQGRAQKTDNKEVVDAINKNGKASVDNSDKNNQALIDTLNKNHQEVIESLNKDNQIDERSLNNAFDDGYSHYENGVTSAIDGIINALDKYSPNLKGFGLPDGFYSGKGHCVPLDLSFNVDLSYFHYSAPVNLSTAKMCEFYDGYPRGLLKLLMYILTAFVLFRLVRKALE